MVNINVLRRTLNLARGVLLGRLLVPDVFGLFGLVTVGLLASLRCAGMWTYFNHVELGCICVPCEHS
jgi:hypothetical protein